MTPSRAELLRRRRCRLLVVGMVLGAFLPVYQRSWVVLGVAVVGISVLVVVYRRECRGTFGPDSTQDDTDTRASGP